MQETVQKYYGETLTGTHDLQTNACCTEASLPNFVKPLMARVHDEVLTRYYGCGLVLPELLDGLTILDLGCGAGRDVYVLAQLVGEKGQVIGVDMTEAQLAVARRHEKFHQKAFGYKRSNVRFLHGHIERLHELGLKDDSVDVIVSNCVINLVQDKAAVLRETFRVLKPGGEFYFSDVYSDRRIPEALTHDPVLYGECLSGAMYWNDFLQLSRKSGFTDPRLPIWPKKPAISVFTRRPIACSSCMTWSLPARITGNRWCIAAPYPTTAMHSGWTNTISSKPANSFQCVVIPGACCMTRGSKSISIFMATLTGTTVFFRVAGWVFRLRIPPSAGRSVAAVDNGRDCRHAA